MITAAVDFGRLRIGLAATGEHGVIFPVTTIQQRSRATSLAALAHHLAELHADRVIVGWPLNMDGSVGPQARAAEKFAAELRVNTGLPIELFDERLSSFEARERLRDRGLRRRKGDQLDAIAACIILEGWLAQPQEG